MVVGEELVAVGEEENMLEEESIPWEEIVRMEELETEGGNPVPMGPVAPIQILRSWR